MKSSFAMSSAKVHVYEYVRTVFAPADPKATTYVALLESGVVVSFSLRKEGSHVPSCTTDECATTCTRAEGDATCTVKHGYVKLASAPEVLEGDVFKTLMEEGERLAVLISRRTAGHHLADCGAGSCAPACTAPHGDVKTIAITTPDRNMRQRSTLSLMPPSVRIDHAYGSLRTDEGIRQKNEVWDKTLRDAVMGSDAEKAYDELENAILAADAARLAHAKEEEDNFLGFFRRVTY